MPPLDYETPQPAPSSDLPPALRAAIVVPPAVTLLLTAIIILRVLDEPFGIFRWGDAIVLLGGPVLVAAVWLAWAGVALRHRRRLRSEVRWLLLGVACWGGVNVWFVVATCFVRYLREPWNV